ncbi:hypothetical protein FHW06_004069 [Pantoea agglomerans]
MSVSEATTGGKSVAALVESLSLKQRVYSVQDKLIELALW